MKKSELDNNLGSYGGNVMGKIANGTDHLLARMSAWCLNYSGCLFWGLNGWLSLALDLALDLILSYFPGVGGVTHWDYKLLMALVCVVKIGWTASNAENVYPFVRVWREFWSKRRVSVTQNEKSSVDTYFVYYLFSHDDRRNSSLMMKRPSLKTPFSGMLVDF